MATNDAGDQRPAPASVTPRGRRRVAVAGASGFIGSALSPRLAQRFEVVGLTRSPARAATPDPDDLVQWRHCDLFRYADVEAGLGGADYAVYLVHSLAPSSRLTQAAPRDMDLVLADNFARAAAAMGVRQIVFVSAVMPESFRFSPLLWSRREVEMVLGSRGTPVTALRASLVVGPGGTGPRLLVDLVRRLPLLLLPPQADSLTRPIALGDLVRAVLYCLGRPEELQGTFDIGGRDALSYRQMLRETADVLGVRRVFVRAPFLPIRLASLLARTVSGAPAPTVGAIVESLPQDTTLRDNPVQRAITPDATSFRDALTAAVDPGSRRLLPNPRTKVRDRDRDLMRSESLVRSIQRVLLPPGQDAAWVAGNYFRWLGSCCWPVVGTQTDDADNIDVYVRIPHIRLLSLWLEPAESTPDRRVYHIVGGLLVREDASGRARFELQTLLDGRYTMTAIHDYAPALPWYLYIPTQAFAHLRVMRRYQRRLARLAR